MGQKSKINIINQAVDTLVLQFYPSFNLTLEDTTFFNNEVEELSSIKKEAMLVKSNIQQDRYINHELFGYKFRVMATAQGSFNVILQNGDITLAFRKINSNTSNPNIKVEFRAEFLARFGYVKAIESVKRLINSILPHYIIKVSRIDLCTDVQGFNFQPLDFHKFKTVSRNNKEYFDEEKQSYYKGSQYTGFSFGKGACMFKVYNKSIEIQKDKKKGFIEVLKWSNNPNYDKDKTVWRLEGQLRRERLKELVGHFGVLDSLDSVLRAIPSLWKYFIDRYVFKSLTDFQIFEQLRGYKVLKNGSFKMLTKEAIKSRFRRADIHSLWDIVKDFNSYKGYPLSKFKQMSMPTVEYVVNSLKSVVSTLVKHSRGNFSAKDLTQILLDADKDSLLHKGHSLLNIARFKALDFISEVKMQQEVHGVVMDSFESFHIDMVNNLNETWAMLENEPCNIQTFKEFNKRLKNVS